MLGSLGYLIAIFSLLSIEILLFSDLLNEELNLTLYRKLIFSKELFSITAYCFIIGSLINFISEIDKKFGPGNLQKMLTVEYYRPKVENRIFMFIDLRSSTSVAEKLGHIKYSELIQDCFRDFSIVADYKPRNLSICWR